MYVQVHSLDWCFFCFFHVISVRIAPRLGCVCITRIGSRGEMRHKKPMYFLETVLFNGQKTVLFQLSENHLPRKSFRALVFSDIFVTCWIAFVVPSSGASK